MKCLLVCVFTLPSLAGSLAIGCQEKEAPSSNKSSHALSVKELLKYAPRDERGLLEQPSPFIKTFKELMRQQGVDPAPYLLSEVGKWARSGAVSGGYHTEGRAFEVDVGGSQYVVVVLWSPPILVPAGTGQQLLLLDSKGRVLDKLGCTINNRYGRLRTEAITKSDKIGVHVVIKHLRYTDEIDTGSEMGTLPWYTVSHRGEAYTFSEREGKYPFFWWKIGICALRIEKNGFVVVTPKLEKSDRELIEEMEKKPKP